MMQHIKQMNILDMMKMYGEDSCRAVLSTFMCPLNIDVEDFIDNGLPSHSLFSRKQKAILPLSVIIRLLINSYQYPVHT